jgi:hypothetical protein
MGGWGCRAKGALLLQRQHWNIVRLTLEQTRCVSPSVRQMTSGCDVSQRRQRVSGSVQASEKKCCERNLASADFCSYLPVQARVGCYAVGFAALLPQA